MNFEDSQKLAIGTQSKLLIFNVCRLECCHWVSDICVSCALGKNHAMYVLCGLDVAHLLHVHVLKGHCLHPPSNHFRTRASAMAHQEAEMRPPDHEPGAIGSYTITHACVIDGEQIFHMELSGINYSLELSGMHLTLQQWCITHSDMYHLDAMGHTGFSRRISAAAIASWTSMTPRGVS